MHPASPHGRRISNLLKRETVTWSNCEPKSDGICTFVERGFPSADGKTLIERPNGGKNLVQ